ncbi:endonuclease/exonuclease/phosphatase family protein [Rhodoligotrophos defluvii]|uniref:endonuclease/exonuclease/phosphatase family protein n=1 Tax=Rhodoligotrophos defluvii TaxID=2561934 RepID=UPI0010C9EAEB|nr:endonuclease/exonuclease/phosphatase family protein [Rhodoligotrophos defluvii]
MRIMCLNGWGGTLHDRLIPYLRAESPDVLCLQEVVHTPDASRDWLEYRDGTHVLPQRANFFREVAAALPDHVASFCPAAQGVLWDGQETIPSQWGLATFVRASFPIIGQAQVFVHKSFSSDGFGEHPRSRNAHAVRIWDMGKARTVTVAHMHGLRDLNGKMDTPERLAQARRFADLISYVAEQGDQIVACGDFNLEPSSLTFEVLGGLGLKDLVTARNHVDTRTSHYKKAGRYADYMLVNSAVDVIRFDVVVEPEVSDHRPLVLEF